MRKAEHEFIRHCETDYYAEWFWFSLHTNGWVNCWKNNADRREAKTYPSPFSAKIQEVEEYLLELLNRSVMGLLSDRLQATLYSDGGMLSLPAETTIKTPLIGSTPFSGERDSKHASVGYGI